MKEDFVLPEKWAVRITKENRDVLIKWAESNVDYEDDHDVFCVGWFVVSKCEANSYQLWTTDLYGGDYTEITFEQFKKYVLGMKEQEQQKEIVGWKLKEHSTSYIDAINSIIKPQNKFPLITGSTELSYRSQAYSIGLLKQAGVLDLWFEPVYKEEEKFKVGDWVKLSETANGWGAGSEICNAVVKLTEIKKELYNEKVYFIHEGFIKRTNYNEISRLATPEEIKTAQYPQIIINDYRGEFFSEYVKFGCAKIDKDLIINLYNTNSITYRGTRTSFESVTIGKGTFSKEQIKAIAEYYLNKK